MQTTRLLFRPFGSNRWKCTVAMAMSGGIDSSVSALLLKEQGYDVRGVFMRNWDRDDEAGAATCPIDQDLEDANEVCQRLNIPLVEVNFAKEYWTDVFVPLLADYQSGARTPNPDVSCNRSIKFNLLLRFALNKMSCNKLATGHYCQLHTANNTAYLLRGADCAKDQSYFLCTTPSTALNNAIFPIGHLTKTQVKSIAAQHFTNLRVLSKRESMGVCFIGKRNMKTFLPEYINTTPGRFIHIDTGAVLGQHNGIEVLTPGQGARISGLKSKHYIVRKDPSNGDVFVTSEWSHSALLQNVIHIPLREMHWINGCPPLQLSRNSTLRCFCQTRHLQQPTECEVTLESDSEIVRIRLLDPVRAVVPGQVAALYTTIDGSYSADATANIRCLGGGAIGIAE